jgi:hypothetical protein
METTTGAQSKADTAETNAKNWAKSFGLGDVSTAENTDLNNIDATGFYRAGGGTLNTPRSNVSWFVLNFKATSLYKTQLAVRYLDGTPEMHVRQLNNGTWTAWKEYASQDWVKSFGLGGTTNTTTDPNVLDGSGFYFVQNTATNVPVTGVYYGLTHIKTSDTGAMQIAVMMNGTSGNRTFTRTKASGTWNAWAELLTTDNGVPYTGATKEVDLGTQLLRSRGTRYQDRNANGVEWELTEDLSNTGKFQLRKYVNGAYTSSPMNVLEDGIFSFPFQSNVDLSLSAAQTVATNTNTKPNFGVSKDTQGEYDTTNKRIVVKEAGTYTLSAYTSWGSGNGEAGKRAGIIIYVNGGVWAPPICATAMQGTQDYDCGGSQVRPFSAGDVIEVYLWHNMSASKSFTNTRFAMTKIA